MRSLISSDAFKCPEMFSVQIMHHSQNNRNTFSSVDIKEWTYMLPVWISVKKTSCCSFYIYWCFSFLLFFNLNCSYVGNLTLLCGSRRYLFIWCMLRGLQNFPASAYLWCHVHKSFRNFHIDFWGNRQQGSLTWENGISMECLTWVVSPCFFLLYQRYPGCVAI